jgi:hypothetical protein
VEPGVDFSENIVRMPEFFNPDEGMWKMEGGPGTEKNSPVFDLIVLIGMVLNILLAVILVLYYFGLL